MDKKGRSTGIKYEKVDESSTPSEIIASAVTVPLGFLKNSIPEYTNGNILGSLKKYVAVINKTITRFDELLKPFTTPPTEGGVSNKINILTSAIKSPVQKITKLDLLNYVKLFNKYSRKAQIILNKYSIFSFFNYQTHEDRESLRQYLRAIALIATYINKIKKKKIIPSIYGKNGKLILLKE